MTAPASAPGRQVAVTEVSPRDGLQSEKAFVPTEDKIRLVESLVAAGIRSVELTSFVSPRAVPQMRDAAELVRHFRGRAGVRFSALAPNLRGAEAAIEAGIDAVVMFASASESHNLKNVNRSRADSIAGFHEIARLAQGSGVALHGAIATAFGCPFEGDVPVGQLAEQAMRYRDLGISRITLGDTTGMATPGNVVPALDALRKAVPEVGIALHFHNTRGVGLACAYAGLLHGIRDFEASVGGIGGCPFVPRATGNIATEDFVYLCEESGFPTGIDLGRLIESARTAERILGRELPGQVMKAGPRLALSSMDAVRTAHG
ncbi:hydroxymethylglutaryl-CoA lyase [Paracoccus versutus]|uniref:hydroxymethylglutaryl-CoA lyase n=1 Tax=Paracoccus versutus TaxID=34007 RepID=UPI000DF81FE9|nr:hydroxymethylglutaryl-CoA lyase [Paracoccus versutus]RDD72223.1 hydroxymethylglutaryl-CoA lyase [Paracoccus versutus]